MCLDACVLADISEKMSRLQKRHATTTAANDL